MTQASVDLPVDIHEHCNRTSIPLVGNNSTVASFTNTGRYGELPKECNPDTVGSYVFPNPIPDHARVQSRYS